MESKLEKFLDPNFRFDEESHTYTYINPVTGKPIQKFQPVTNFLDQFKQKFDSERISFFVARKQGVSQSSILEQWANKGKVATTLGSAVHKWIEDYYSGLDPADHPDPRVMDRVQKFKEIYAARLHKLSAVKQEFRLFSRKWNIAGTTDILFKLDPDYYVGDWKTNENFWTNDRPNPKAANKKLLYPFEDLYENSLNLYSIQLSLYRLLLQEEAGFETKGAFLVWIGPEKPELHKTVDLRDRLYTFLQKNNNTDL